MVKDYDKELQALSDETHFDYPDLRAAVEILRSGEVAPDQLIPVLRKLCRAAIAANVHWKAAEIASFSVELVRESEAV